MVKGIVGNPIHIPKEGTIAPGVVKIQRFAHNNTYIESVEIPASVKEIDYSFFNCKKLKSITFEKKVNWNVFLIPLKIVQI